MNADLCINRNSYHLFFFLWLTFSTNFRIVILKNHITSLYIPRKKFPSFEWNLRFHSSLSNYIGCTKCLSNFMESFVLYEIIAWNVKWSETLKQSVNELIFYLSPRKTILSTKTYTRFWISIGIEYFALNSHIYIIAYALIYSHLHFVLFIARIYRVPKLFISFYYFSLLSWNYDLSSSITRFVLFKVSKKHKRKRDATYEASLKFIRMFHFWQRMFFLIEKHCVGMFLLLGLHEMLNL